MIAENPDKSVCKGRGRKPVCGFGCDLQPLLQALCLKQAQLYAGNHCMGLGNTPENALLVNFHKCKLKPYHAK